MQNRAAFTMTALRAALLLVISGPAPAADFEAGQRAFRAGDTAAALAEWRPLALAGHAAAQHALGEMHEYGRGVTRSDADAVRWYEKAAHQNMPDAQYRLGVLLDNGWGTAPDAAAAAGWYARAAQSGHAFAQHDLAFMYLKGKGVPQDSIQAYKWLKIATTGNADLMTKHLQTVAQQMTPAEIRTAEWLARAWLQSERL